MDEKKLLFAIFDGILIIADIKFKLYGAMIDPKVFEKDIFHVLPNRFCFTDRQVFFKVGMAFKMKFFVAKAPQVNVVNITDPINFG